ncbi:MAG: ASKHA domain-containing protein [Acidimicrobiaceae bacterium]|nr:DUF4445 domain-containing protein [Acidimicrobiia bacterium]MCY4495334.1 ASKHA domain-containing protein [Acidimicrobiaceae bacterium]
MPAEPASSGADAAVIFMPSGRRVTVPVGTTVLDAARSGGIDLDSTCGGRGLCGRCQVSPSFGEFAKWNISSSAQSLNAWTQSEDDYRGRRAITSGNRLGCQAIVRSGVVIDVPTDSAVHRPVVRKKINLEGLTVDPMITARYVEVPAQVLGDERALSDLLADSLESDWGIAGATVDARVLGDLGPAVSDGERAITAIVHCDGTVLAVRAGFDEAVYGVAIDVGSTTIAGYLVDLASGDVVAHAGTMNPQIRFGEDLMSRVSYVMMNPGGEQELTSVVREALDGLIDDLADEFSEPGGELRTRIHDLVVVGNPVMHHLLLGIDPTPLGAAPFTLAVSAPVDMRADELGLSLRFARAHVGPCIAGHVGADASAAVLNEGTHRSTAPQLMVDVGTNAEIVLGTATKTYAASSPTGPAFEGAQISCGMRATAGAIERVRIDRETFAARYKVIGSDLWSDDPGFAQDVAHLDIAGLCGSAIIEVIGEMFLAGVCDSNGVIGASLAMRTPYVEPEGRTFRYVIRSGPAPLFITQNDVRQIQLAGAALRAGIDLLMEHAGVAEVADVRLAGAFGAHIDPLYALVLGLVPDCEPSAVKAVGNASGAGAVRMLLSAAQRREIAQTVSRIEKIETATEPRFQELFVAAMAFPHQSAPPVKLSKVVDLPQRQPSVAAGHRKRRRRTLAAETHPTEAT